MKKIWLINKVSLRLFVLTSNKEDGPPLCTEVKMHTIFIQYFMCVLLVYDKLKRGYLKVTNDFCFNKMLTHQSLHYILLKSQVEHIEKIIG